MERPFRKCSACKLSSIEGTREVFETSKEIERMSLLLTLFKVSIKWVWAVLEIESSTYENKEYETILPNPCCVFTE